jgi:apolipoprotein N-acyltransferase
METERDKQLWELAKKRAKFKRYFYAYLIVTLFWVFWFFTDHQDPNSGLPWPMFPTLTLAVVLAYIFLNVYVFSNHNAIEREYERLTKKKD